MIAIFYICNAIQEKNSVKFCLKQYQNSTKTRIKILLTVVLLLVGIYREVVNISLNYHVFLDINLNATQTIKVVMVLFIIWLHIISVYYFLKSNKLIIICSATLKITWRNHWHVSIPEFDQSIFSTFHIWLEWHCQTESCKYLLWWLG